MKYHYSDLAAVDVHMSMTVYEIELLIKWLKGIENPDSKYTLQRMLTMLDECISNCGASMKNEGELLLGRKND
jgi:hypothetical protein